MKKVLSGIQPSGGLHLGNYIGAIQQWVEMQDDHDVLYCIVDLHAITVFQNPSELRENILDSAAMYLAAGLDPSKMKLFVQSENPDHAYLTWILNCITPYGQLLRMTQFKDKSAKQKDSTTAGLFDYPVLMASDILLYDTDVVPVGDDQSQHLELTRDLAEKFNSAFGDVFVVPEIRLVKHNARVMSLLDPLSKMSKSDENRNATIFLLDDIDEISNKIKRAVTDSGDAITYSKDKPALSNLLGIFSAVAGISVPELEKRYSGASYKEFKDDLATAVSEFLGPFQTRYHEVRRDVESLNKILDEGVESARTRSNKKVRQVIDAVGLGRVQQ